MDRAKRRTRRGGRRDRGGCPGGSKKKKVEWPGRGHQEERREERKGGRKEDKGDTRAKKSRREPLIKEKVDPGSEKRSVKKKKHGNTFPGGSQGRADLNEKGTKVACSLKEVKTEEGGGKVRRTSRPWSG